MRTKRESTKKKEERFIPYLTINREGANVVSHLRKDGDFIGKPAISSEVNSGLHITIKDEEKEGQRVVRRRVNDGYIFC